IVFQNSNASSIIRVIDCDGEVHNNPFFSKTSPGILRFLRCRIENPGNSTANSLNSNGLLSVNYCVFGFAISLNNSGVIRSRFSAYITNLLNTTPLTISNSGIENIFQFCEFSSGDAPSINISGALSTVTTHHCNFDSSNASGNAVVGIGSFTFSSLTFSSSARNISVSTQAPRTFRPGILQSTQQPAF